MRSTRWIWPTLWSLAIGGACASPGSGGDSETNWLKSCDSSIECGKHGACLCGLCTIACDTAEPTKSCAAGPHASKCVIGASATACAGVTSPPAGICLGAGGSGGAGGASGAGARDASSDGCVGAACPGSVTCSGTACDGAVVGGKTLPACCSPAGKCGVEQILKGCVERNRPGAETPACVAQDVTVTAPVHMKGCCQANGTCGLHADLTSVVAGLDFGCVDPSAVPGAGGATTGSCGSGGAIGAGGGLATAGAGGAGGCFNFDMTPAQPTQPDAGASCLVELPPPDTGAPTLFRAPSTTDAGAAVAPVALPHFPAQQSCGATADRWYDDTHPGWAHLCPQSCNSSLWGGPWAATETCACSGVDLKIPQSSVGMLSDSCRLALPKPPGGQAFDRAMLNLVVQRSSLAPHVLMRHNPNDPAVCPFAGWAYDVASGTPSEIIICGSALQVGTVCRDVLLSDGFTITTGCPTISMGTPP